MGVEYNNLELVKEYPTIIAGKYPLRLYRSRDDARSNYRYHFGFLEKIVEPIHKLLECSPYWGEQHWKEEDGFWLWWLAVTSETEDIPSASLNRELKWRISSINDVLRFYKNALESTV